MGRRVWTQILAMLVIALQLVATSAATLDRKAAATVQQPRPTPTREAESCLARGRALLERGRYEEAVTELSEAIRIAPEYAEAYATRGLAYAALGDYEQAMSDYGRAVAADPEFASVYLEKIISDLSLRITRNPRDAMAYMGRGIAHFALSEYGQAVADFTHAIAFAPEDAAAMRQLRTLYFCRGWAYFMIREYGHAMEDWSKTLSEDPSPPPFINPFGKPGSQAANPYWSIIGTGAAA